jgi:mRNA-degrading endonuclease RelE of RelBE toxin-antitoxin system
LSRTSISVSETARIVLRKLHPDIKRSIRRGLDELQADPFAGKPLKEELSGLWSLAVANYRVIYQLERSKITVVFIGARRDVYERLRELLSNK